MAALKREMAARAKSERELKESEERLRQMQEAMENHQRELTSERCLRERSPMTLAHHLQKMNHQDLRKVLRKIQVKPKLCLPKQLRMTFKVTQ